MDEDDIKRIMAQAGNAKFLNISIPTCISNSPNATLEMLFSGSQTSSHRSPWIFTCLVVLYALFSTIGCVLNVVIVIVIVFLMPRLLHNVTNIFVLTLAFSDIFMCAFNMPIQVFYEREQMNWNEVLCRVFFSTFGLPLYVSTFTILLIAVDRYRMILHPLKARMSRPVAIILVFVTIAISVLSAIPVAFYSQLSTPQAELVNNSKYQYCVEVWPSPKLRLAYSAWTFTIQFLSPLVVTAILYFQIYARLRQRILTKKDDDKKKRTNKILMGIVTCFAVCWTPFAIYSLLLEIRGYLAHIKKVAATKPGALIPTSLCQPPNKIFIPEQHVKLIDLLLKVFAMASACINPFLYGWLNESIRDSINNALSWGRRKDPQGVKMSYAHTYTRYTPGEYGPYGVRSGTEMSAVQVDGKESNGVAKGREEEKEEELGEDLPNVIVHSPHKAEDNEGKMT